MNAGTPTRWQLEDNSQIFLCMQGCMIKEYRWNWIHFICAACLGGSFIPKFKYFGYYSPSVRVCGLDKPFGLEVHVHWYLAHSQLFHDSVLHAVIENLGMGLGICHDEAACLNSMISSHAHQCTYLTTGKGLSGIIDQLPLPNTCGMVGLVLHMPLCVYGFPVFQCAWYCGNASQPSEVHNYDV